MVAVVAVEAAAVFPYSAYAQAQTGATQSAVQHPFVGPVIGFLASVVAALVGLGGVYYALQRNVDTQAAVRKLEMKLKYVESQLEKFYGPLLAECIEADGMFRRVELAMQIQGHSSHRHYDFRSLIPSDFKPASGKEADYLPCEDPLIPEEDRHRRFFATMLLEVFLPSNEKRLAIIRNNLHLLGPFPPTSIHLFIAHAAQLRGLVRIKQHVRLDGAQQPDRYTDPYILTPFPPMMTGEIAAKVALLKSLQREYQFRLRIIGKREDRKRQVARTMGGNTIGRFANLLDNITLRFGRRKKDMEVFRRDEYYLLLNESLWDELNQLTDTQFGNNTDFKKKRKPECRAFYPPGFPLVWGPYSAVELFELRSWLIHRERNVRGITGMQAERKIYVSMLRGDLAKVDREDPGIAEIDRSVPVSDEYPPVVQATTRKWEGGRRPLSHRVAQMFDELDNPGSKKNHEWDENFTWENLQSSYGDRGLKKFALCGFSLVGLKDAGEIAYWPAAYDEMRADD